MSGFPRDCKDIEQLSLLKEATYTIDDIYALPDGKRYVKTFNLIYENDVESFLLRCYTWVCR